MNPRLTLAIITLAAFCIAVMSGWSLALTCSLAALYGMFLGMWIESRKS